MSMSDVAVRAAYPAFLQTTAEYDEASAVTASIPWRESFAQWNAMLDGTLIEWGNHPPMLADDDEGICDSIAGDSEPRVSSRG